MSNGSNKKDQKDQKEKKGKKGRQPEQLMSPEQREEQIRLAAYYRWEAKGRNTGADRDDWFEAQDSLIEDFSD
ncbi:MAG: DUF2934 domain-containing protein [Chlorobiaceae bacterium]